MSRLLLLIVLGLLASLYLPESRAALVNVTAPALNPALRWQTLHEMGTIAEDVSLHERENPGEVPAPNAFRGWLHSSFTPGAAQDSWGGSYVILIEADSFAIVSWGPDRVPRTGDDLRVARALTRGRP